MALFGKVTGLIKKATTKAKDTFLPSEKVSAARRKETFGTESKAVAGVAIIGAAAIAAASTPAAIVGGAAKVAQKVGSSFAASSLTTQATVVTGGLIAAGAVSSNPALLKKAASVPAGLVNIGSNVGKVSKNPSLEGVKNIVKENPVLTSALGAAALVGVSGAAVKTLPGVISSLSLAKAVEGMEESTGLLKDVIVDGGKIANPAIVSSIPPGAIYTPGADTVIKTPGVPNVSTVPLTPSTQVVGKSVTTSSRAVYKRRKAASMLGQRQSTRINIYNLNKGLYRRYA